MNDLIILIHQFFCRHNDEIVGEDIIIDDEKYEHIIYFKCSKCGRESKICL